MKNYFMSIKKQTISYILYMKKEYINHHDLVETISKLTNYPFDSVRGTLLISQKKIREICNKSSSTYLQNYKNLGSIIVKNKFLHKYVTKIYGTSKYTYETENKQLSRDFLYSFFRQKGNILTFGGSEGKDIQHIIENLNYNKIYNLEKDKDEFEKYIKLPFSTKSENLKISFYDFYLNNKILFDLVNYDSLSYLSDKVSKDFILMNKKRNARVIAITLSKMENGVRNHGNFSDYLRKKYKKNITTNFLKDTLSFYKLIKRYDYQREKGTQPMVIYIFKIKK